VKGVHGRYATKFTFRIFAAIDSEDETFRSGLNSAGSRMIPLDRAGKGLAPFEKMRL
jgi:hypothetical protein